MSLADQQWCPTSVQVTVLQARGLRIKGKGGTNDAYALMQVGKEKYQTSVVEKTVAPTWKEEATFDLPPLQGGGGGKERSTLRVHVLHRALVGPDKLLGQAVIDLLQLSDDKTRNKTEWFKLLDKTGKPDKDRGEVFVDIQFMRNNMTASMFDLSAAGKSRSRLGKFKDKVRGKKRESDSSSGVVPSITQVLTDSEEDDTSGGGEGATGKDGKSKQHKRMSLFSSKSNLQRNMSQSMSVLPGKNSSLSGSQSSGLNVDSSEGKKKFKFKIHKHSSNSKSKDSSSGQQKQEQSNVCINGSHIYCEEAPSRPLRTGSSFSQSSSINESREDAPENFSPSVDSLKAQREYSPWMEEEEEDENIKDLREEEEEEKFELKTDIIKEEEEEAIRKQQGEQDRLTAEKLREDEENRVKKEEMQRLEEEKRWLEEQERRKFDEEEKMRREEEEKIKEELDRKRHEEELKLAEERRLMEEEEERRMEEKVKHEQERAEEMWKKEQEEKKKREEEDRLKKEEKRIQEETARRENDHAGLMAEKKQEERGRMDGEEKFRKAESERIRNEEMKRKNDEEKLAEMKEQEQKRREDQQKMQREEERKRAEEQAKRQEEERIQKEKMQREEEEKRRLERLAKEKLREEERIKAEEEEEEERTEKEKMIKEEKAKKESMEKEMREEKERIQKEKMSREKEEERRRHEELEWLAKQKLRKEEEERRNIEEEAKREEERIQKEIQREEERMEREMRGKEERIKEEKKTAEEIERKGFKDEKEKGEEERRQENLTKGKEGKIKDKEISGTKLKLRVPVEITSTNPFDENISPPLETNISSKEKTDDQRCQSGVPSVNISDVTTNERDLINTQRGKRTAPKPPGRNQPQRQRREEEDMSSTHLSQMNKQSKDKNVKTVSVAPQRSVQIIAPLNRPSKDLNNLSQTEKDFTKEETTKNGKRPAPSIPCTAKDEPHRGVLEIKKDRAVYGLNPFEDDDDDTELTAFDETTNSGKTDPVCWPPVKQETDKDDAKIKSSKMARAPLPPPLNETPSNSIICQNRDEDGGSDAIRAIVPNKTCNPQKEATSHVQVKESPNRESKQIGTVAAIKEEGPPAASRRLQPVKPLNPLEQQSDSVVKVGNENRATGLDCNGVQHKTNVGTERSGPYSQLTREELIALLLKQESQLSERDKKISELEQYIDNLLVRVIEEKPSILMSLSSLKKAA
ncbi:PREDICTED: rab11 family-interacting protein 1 [Cyprinodon variegatus]|uniref:rab11 family-interacting protein 1 n=1 Tax=Cyprinodon variegatus TaxID=28743 RepID=UPI0007428F50|nr:PREDICTED: rab11 family-interacting protein 1 [Cyprinodon variegatus]